ncbi:MAG: hypothetical protein WC346_12420 [Methanogenium sp.]|jgi:hypothetical protein
MANEAVCIETPTKFARYTVADGTGIAIGTLLYFSGDCTVSASSAADQSFAGIAWEEKTASDGITQITAALDGVWDIKATAAANVLGELVAVGGANLIVSADAADILNGAIVGYLEEAQDASEVCRVRLTKF